MAPLLVSATVPTPGYLHTLVGYGGFGSSCVNSGNGVKRYGSTYLDSVYTYAAPGGRTLEYYDTNIGACPGDSGGPAIYGGEVVGVASHGDSTSNSNYDPTATAYSWLRSQACPFFDKAYPDTNMCDDPLCPCVSAEGDCDQAWQCSSGNSCIADIGAASGLAATEDLCWSNGHLVTFYSGLNYTGTAYKLPVGTWNYPTIIPNIGNDTISSLTAGPGLWVQLWAEGDCWGDSQNYFGSVPNVGSLMDNRTSCLKVFPAVTYYAGQNYAGSVNTLPPGSYNHSHLGLVGNDNAESMIAAPGLLVRMCSESGTPGTTGWGTCVNLSGQVTSLGTLNNNVSNIEVFSGVTVYRESDYGGVSQTFAQGSYGAASLGTVGNDQISSLIVAPGMKATLCSEDGGWGDCKEYTGWNSFVGFVGTGPTRVSLNDRTSHITVSPL